MQYTEFLESILAEAGALAQGYFGKVSGAVKTGDNNQVLTEADVAVGKMLVDAVRTAYLEHNIIDEEAGVIDNGSRFTWVIDPIDGTSNFAAGLPDYGIMVGLLEGAEPIAGGITLPAFQKVYLAERGLGATCNGEAIHVSSEPELSNALMAFGIDGLPDNPQKNKQQCDVLADLLPAIRNMRNCGSDAVDPMRVAEGTYGGKLQVCSKIWDNVAPHIICEEAGALWTTANGYPADYSNPLERVDQNFTFCVAPPALHEQLQKIVRGRLDA